MIAGTEGFGEGAVGVRALTAADLGVEGGLGTLKGTIGVKDGIATVRVDMIEGKITNSFEDISNLAKVAESLGAETLKIEGTLANETLERVLTRRYGMTVEKDGVTSTITIPLKK